MDKTSIILKRDTRGRVRTPVERRKALVAEFGRSGLSAMRFAAMAGISYNTFWTWLQKHGGQPRQTARKTACKPKFVEVVMAAPPPCPAPEQPALPLLVTLPGGEVLSLAHQAQVPLAAQLIQALAKPC